MIQIERVPGKSKWGGFWTIRLFSWRHRYTLLVGIYRDLHEDY